MYNRYHSDLWDAPNHLPIRYAQHCTHPVYRYLWNLLRKLKLTPEATWNLAMWYRKFFTVMHSRSQILQTCDSASISFKFSFDTSMFYFKYSKTIDKELTNFQRLQKDWNNNVESFHFLPLFNVWLLLSEQR